MLQVWTKLMSVWVAAARRGGASCLSGSCARLPRQNIWMGRFDYRFTLWRRVPRPRDEWTLREAAAPFVGERVAFFVGAPPDVAARLLQEESQNPHRDDSSPDCLGRHGVGFIYARTQ